MNRVNNGHHQEESVVAIEKPTLPAVHIQPSVEVEKIVQSLVIDEVDLARELKDVLKGCEANLDVIQTVQIIERPHERIAIYKKKLSLGKDK